MKTRVYFFIALALMIAILLAFFLREAITEWIIIPFAKFIWLVKGYYGAFPQAAYWVIALGIAALVALLTFRLPDWGIKHKNEHGRAFPSSIRERTFLLNFGRPERYVRSLPGPIREISFWIQRSKGGIFPKWHIARILAELALDIIDRRGTRQKHTRQITGPAWSPPAEVKNYLDAALTTNYTDYPRRKRFRPQPSTPFDQDLEPVIKYLESLLESEHDNHS